MTVLALPIGTARVLRSSASAARRVSSGTRLQGLRNQPIRALRGPVWLTLDNDPRDTVLEAGDLYIVPTDAALVIGPLHRGAAFEVLIGDA